MSARTARHASTAERVIARVEGIAIVGSIIAGLLLAAVLGLWAGLAVPPEPTMPPIVRVVVQPEPQAQQVPDGCQG